MSKAERPWMKWYPADWRSDPGLRMCGFAARGLWADLLALMHEAEPYGHLLVNGKRPTSQQLASLLGGTAKEIDRLLDELEAAGVPSRTDDGTIFSRRMVRDADRAEEGRRAVKKRWGDRDPTPSPNSPPNRSGHSPPTSPPITQKPEARSQKPEGESSPAVSATAPAAGANDAALRIIEAFDAAQEATYAEQRRPWPAQTDLATARRMLDGGFAEDDAKPFFEALLGRCKASGKAAPKALAYAEGAVAEHVAGLKRLPVVVDVSMPNLPTFLDRRPQQPAALMDPQRLAGLAEQARQNRIREGLEDA